MRQTWAYTHLVTVFANTVETVSGAHVTWPAEKFPTMPGFAKMGGVAVGVGGNADTQYQLYRTNAVGVEAEPMISQVQ